jgi:superfamily I DNA/RNA helicase
VDEVQDLKPSEIRFLARLAAKNPGNLMLIGDAGQRIYPGGYSLRRLGIDVRGRSRVLRINYRTTEQIRRFADRILPNQVDDLDDGMESRKGTRSLLRGPAPAVRGFTVAQDQDAFVVEQVRRLLGQGLLPREIAVFARVGARLEPLQTAFTASGIPVHLLSRDEDTAEPDGVHFGTMHRAKGLEYKVIFAYDCSEGVVPHMATLRRHKDPADYEAARAREQQLLYVTITRARDEAFITWVGLPSPFLPDNPSDTGAHNMTNPAPERDETASPT